MVQISGCVLLSILFLRSESNALHLLLDSGFNIIEQDGDLIIKRPDDTKNIKAKHGLYRALIANMFEGLSKDFLIYPSNINN